MAFSPDLGVQRASRAPLVPRPVRVNLLRLPQRFVERRDLARCLTAPVPRLLQHSRLSHLRTVLRDKLVSRTISRTDFFSRKYIRLTLPIMAMVYELLGIRERLDKSGLAQRARQTRYRLSDALQYLETNIQSLIDCRRHKQEGRRISTGFVESTINRVVGRRMCKGRQMRWSGSGADGLIQVRVAVQNREFDEFVLNGFVAEGCGLLQPGRSGAWRLRWLRRDGR